MALARRWRSGLGSNRNRSLLAAVMVAAAAVSGCAAAPGSAVVVGGVSVSDDALQQRTSQLLAQNPSTSTRTDAVTASVNRQQASQAIRHSLIQRATRELGVSVSDEQVNALLAKNGEQKVASELGVPVDEVRGAAQDVLAAYAVVSKLPAAGVRFVDVQVTYDVVGATDRQDAVNKRARFVADPAAMDSYVAENPAKGKMGDHEKASDNSGDSVFGIFRAPVGQILLIPSQNQWAVFRVTGRTSIQSTLTAGSFATITSLSAFFNLFSLLLAPYAASAGVSVNPRYGIWDPVTVQVVPGNDGL